MNDLLRIRFIKVTLPLIFTLLLCTFSLLVKAETNGTNTNKVKNIEKSSTQSALFSNSRHTNIGGVSIPGTGGGGGNLIEDTLDTLTDPFESMWKEMKAAAESAEAAYHDAVSSWNSKYSAKELELNNQITSLNQQFGLKASEYNLEIGDWAYLYQQIAHYLGSIVDAITATVLDLHAWLWHIVNGGGCMDEGDNSAETAVGCLEDGVKIVGALTGNACGITVGAITWLGEETATIGKQDITSNYDTVRSQMNEIYDRFDWHIPGSVKIKQSDLLTANSAMATPYVIYVQNSDSPDSLLAHEFTHLLQYHKWGSTDALSTNMGPVKTMCDSVVETRETPDYHFNFRPNSNLFDYNTEQQAEIVMFYWLFRYYSKTFNRDVSNLRLGQLEAGELEDLKIRLITNPNKIKYTFQNALNYQDKTVEELTVLFANLIYSKIAPDSQLEI